MGGARRKDRLSNTSQKTHSTGSHTLQTGAKAFKERLRIGLMFWCAPIYPFVGSPRPKNRPMKTICKRKCLILLLCLLFPYVNLGGAEEYSGVRPSAVDTVNIVRRSYPYVALYNTFAKWAAYSGWNKILFSGRLAGHTARSVARPNNDTLNLTALLDLRKEAVIVEVPAIDSKYVSMMTSAYDHYIEIPMSTTFERGDFSRPSRVLFYNQRTERYHGEPVEGVDRTCEMTGDFVAMILRAMPHLNDPPRAERIKSQLRQVTLKTLSQFKNGPGIAPADLSFPEFGRTTADVFGTNFLEVMQFVLNHTIFDPNNDMDRALLEACKALGMEPGKSFDPAKAAGIGSLRLRPVAESVEKSVRPPVNRSRLFMPKGRIDLETQLFQTVVGPLGQPEHQAIYLGSRALAKEVLNARNDYVIRIAKDQLPPAKAFWSFTLYDSRTGFFIPNDRQKYSVGENTGYQLNDEGGLDIYISAEKPVGVSDENWLPTHRNDQALDVALRIYAPDFEKMKTWKRPAIEEIKRP